MSAEPPVSLDDILRARSVIAGRLHRTPLLSSRTLGDPLGATVVLKAELFQRTGSFKPRGVLTKLASLDAAQKRRGVIGISAGNHAQALAYCAALEGIDALLVMWEGASVQKIEATRAYGASVDAVASGPREAFDRLTELADASGRTVVHPFDDPLVVAGQGTVGLEILVDAPEVDVVVVPVGGGGLISGIATAVKALRPEARIVAVEPEGSPALHDALAAGRPVAVEATSIADGLGAPFAGQIAVEVCAGLEVETVLVGEDELRHGFRFLYERAKLACEPAGAAAAAALLARKVPVQQGETVAAVVSGGNVAAQTAAAILSQR